MIGDRISIKYYGTSKAEEGLIVVLRMSNKELWIFVSFKTSNNGFEWKERKRGKSNLFICQFTEKRLSLRYYLPNFEYK